MRVFIVDDSKPLRERLVEMLSELPGTEIVGFAENVTQARELIPGSKADAVILDIRMPEGNGIELLKEIKRNDPTILAIMFTNFPDNQYRKRCLDLGADFFFEKSTEFETLIEVFRGLVED